MNHIRKSKKKAMTKKDDIAKEEQYVEFLKKRLASQNFRQNESKAEVEKTERKYDKAKLKLRMLKGELR